MSSTFDASAEAPAPMGHVLARARRKAAKQVWMHRRTACYGVCFITLVIVPLALLGFAVVLALPLWANECADSDDTVDGDDTADVDPCSYYAWLLYILGNLVGLATPLTEITPSAGWFSEVLDLLISVWAISLAGTAIGIIGALVAVSRLGETMEGFIIALFQCDRKEITQQYEPVDFTEFVERMRDPDEAPNTIFADEMDDDQLRRIFKRYAFIQSEGESEPKVPASYLGDIRSDCRQHLDERNMIEVLPLDPRVGTLATELQQVKGDVRELKMAVARCLEILECKTRGGPTLASPRRRVHVSNIEVVAD